MVIAICGACLAVDAPSRSVRIALGSVAPTIVRATEAEALAAGRASTGRPAPSTTPRSPASASSPPRRPGRSTTTAPARPTAAGPSRSSPGACCAAPSRRDEPRRASDWSTASGGAQRQERARTPSAARSEHDERAVPPPRQRHAATRSPTPGSARACCTCCASGSACTAPKGACEQGECGSCSVLVDGELVCSCLVLAASAVDVPITTVEGLAEPGAPTDVQRAFVDAGAVQCGFCTPGLVMAAHALLDRNPAPTRDRDPRGAVRQHLPLHRLRPPHRRRPAGRRARGRRSGRDAARHRSRGSRVGTGRIGDSPVASRRHHQGPGHVRVLVGPADRRRGVGRDAALAAPVRPDRRHRHVRGAGRSRAWRRSSRPPTCPAG